MTGRPAMRPAQPILIAGGGIGGLTLALALARRGFESRILERRVEFSEAGAGIQLSPNAVRVLQRLGVAGTLKQDVGVPQSLRVHQGASGRLLQELPLGSWIAERHGAPYWLAHRRDLQAALLDHVQSEPRIAISLGFEVAVFEDSSQGVLVRSAGGETASGSALIGADGVFSRVRRQLFASMEPRYSGWNAARTVLPADAIGGALPADSVGVWLAPDHHVVHYPVRGGQEIAVVVVSPGDAGETGWAIALEDESMRTALAGFAPAVRSPLESATGWRRWSLFELAPLPRWSFGRVTLLGDAAHPTLPFLAQGGALAMEDADVLADWLAAGPEIEGPLARYGLARMDRTSRVVAAARQNGRIFHLGGLAGRARDLALTLIPPRRAMARFDWVYEWKPGRTN
jgi:salicylate hydroxylase